MAASITTKKALLLKLRLSFGLNEDAKEWLAILCVTLGFLLAFCGVFALFKAQNRLLLFQMETMEFGRFGRSAA